LAIFFFTVGIFLCCLSKLFFFFLFSFFFSMCLCFYSMLSVTVAAPPAAGAASMAASTSAAVVVVSLSERLHTLASAPGYPKQAKELVRKVLENHRKGTAAAVSAAAAAGK
jgi:hypothetical protein